MASKAKLIALFIFLFGLTDALGQNTNSDTVIAQVYRALTLKEPAVDQVSTRLLESSEWEALAYLDMTQPQYDQNSMQEAVGDVYKFSEKRFIIKMIDQSNPSQFGLTVNGDYSIYGNTLHLTKPGAPSFNEYWKVIILDENYMVLDIDGLRIFFTHTQSFFPKTE